MFTQSYHKQELVMISQNHLNDILRLKVKTTDRASFCNVHHEDGGEGMLFSKTL